MPPSPNAPRFLLGKNDSVPTVPQLAGHPPVAVDLAARADRLGRVLDQREAVPGGQRDEHLHGRHLAEEVHGDDARVRGVIAASIAAGAMLNVAGSMSTNTGVPPALWMAPAVAKKVKGVVMTSSPRLQIQRLEREQQRVRAAGAGNGVLRSRERGDGGLELPDFGAHDEGLALDHGHHGREHLVFDAAILSDEVEQRYVHWYRPCGKRPRVGRSGRATGGVESWNHGSRVT